MGYIWFTIFDMKKLDIESRYCIYENLFSQKIVEVLEYRKISISTLADLIEKSQNTISNWKHRRTYPSAPDIDLIAHTTEMKIEFFFNMNMTAEEADKRLESKKKDQALDLIQNILFSSNQEFSEKRQKLASIITRLSDDKLNLALKLLQVVQEV